MLAAWADRTETRPAFALTEAGATATAVARAYLGGTMPDLGAVARLHAAILKPHPDPHTGIPCRLVVTYADALALLDTIRGQCADCVRCDECGTDLCTVHKIGDRSPCVDNDLCMSCWPGRCADCQQAVYDDAHQGTGRG